MTGADALPAADRGHEYDAVLILKLSDGRVVTVRGGFPFKDTDEFPAADSLEFYYTDGNGGCDCALARLVRDQIDPSFLELPCGDSAIEIVSLTIERVT